MSTNSAATSRSSPPKRTPSRERRPRDMLADLTAEQLADPLALAQPSAMRLKPGLELAHLAAVVDRDLDPELTLLDLRQPGSDRAQRIGDRLGGEDRRGEAGGHRDRAQEQDRGPNVLRVPR